MNIYSAIGAGIAYLIVCFFAGKLLPVLHIATIIAAAIGGFIGTIVGGIINQKKEK
jgi:uncharacterized membrane protein YjjB (DUF3815 family)